MNRHAELIFGSVVRDMSDGLITIGLNGVIGYVNRAAEKILDRSAADLQGKRFACCFFEYAQNDGFNQSILDAVYDRCRRHKRVVPYYTGEKTRLLSVTTSFLHEGEERVGVIAVLSDISELEELRDAVKSMDEIRRLNEQLSLRNQLLSDTFGRFLSDEIVRDLLDTPQGLLLGGKKRELTVMMSDLRGFTAMSERMNAQDLIAMLNHYLGEMTEIIQRRGGTIIEFIGDGIMAIFGAPAQSGSHAADAAAAAVEMQARMAYINEYNARRGYPQLEMGVGLHTGEMIVGNIGSSRRTKYGVVGSAVNLCGRIESYTVGGQVLISPATRSAIDEPLTIAAVIEAAPKGVSEPLSLYHITGVGGQYQVSCAQAQEDAPEPLENPRALTLRVLEGKRCTGEAMDASLVALGKGQAVIACAAPLQVLDNLCLYAGGDLLAKVVSGRDGQWLLRFTAVPPGFEAWVRGGDAVSGFYRP